MTELLTTPEAAKILKVSEPLLHKMRLHGTGPAFLKIGAAVRYKLSDLEAWLETRSRASTSDTGELAAAR